MSQSKFVLISLITMFSETMYINHGKTVHVQYVSVHQQVFILLQLFSLVKHNTVV